MMITIVTVWLCLITHVACDVLITVNNNGSGNDKCCMYGTCPCSSLSSALHNVSDNTVIYITSESVTLHDIVGMGSGNLNHITITGNGATIMCNNTGGVSCESCSNITIMGTTWYQCGRNDSNHPITQSPALNFTTVSNINIYKCTFTKSSGCPVLIQHVSYSISITECTFLANVFDFADDDDDDFLCAGLYITSNTQSVLTINNSKFDGNGCVQNASRNFCPYYSAVIYNDFSDYNHFLFRNINFSNNSNGMFLWPRVRNAVIELININVCESMGNGIYVALSGSGTANDSASTISILSASFINNAFAFVIGASEDLNNLSVSIDSCNFSNTHDNIVQSALQIDLSSTSNFVTVSNAIFYNNRDGAVRIGTSNQNSLISCIHATIVIVNVTIYNTTRSSNIIDSNTHIFIIVTEDAGVSIMLEKVRFTSNYLNTQYRSFTYRGCINNYFKTCGDISSVSIQLSDCTFDENAALDHLVALYVIIYAEETFDIYDGDSTVTSDISINITLSGCDFDYNYVGKSIVYVNTPKSNAFYDEYGIPKRSLILNNSTFSNNKGTAVDLIIPRFHFEGSIQFMNNSATNGAAVYLEEVFILSSHNADIQFINNYAEQNGGAMYINLGSDRCNVFQNISNTSNISFTNNIAGIAGNSIYFNIPQNCPIITDTDNKSSLLYFPSKFKYFQSNYTINSPIVASAYNIKLYSPAVAIHKYSNDYLIKQSKMLGEPIQFTALVLDYFNNITEPITFSINCRTCGDDYILSTYQITVHDHSIHELKVFPTAHNDLATNKNISLMFLSALPSIYRSINASLSVELSSCRAGYLFNNAQCVCYPHNDLVHCRENYVEIKIGYWIGFLTEQQYTSSICPSNYCDTKRTETSPGYYNLSGKLNDQCSSHRTGVSCGKCKSGYTLAYDSPDCINTDKCSTGMTILVIVLTILYWIAIVAVVFGLMYFQFQISSGYAYGIIYYYSIVDILLVNDVSEEVFQLVAILSSFAKLTPQLFGQLCLTDYCSSSKIFC